MKTLLPLVIALGLAAGGCRRSAKHDAEVETLRSEIQVQREEVTRLRQARSAEYQNWRRALTDLQAQVQQLDGTLKLTSAEIWGDGSPTSARLAIAQRSLAAIQAGVDDLVRELNATARAP